MSEKQQDTEYWALEDTQPIPISTSTFDDAFGWWGRYGSRDVAGKGAETPWGDESHRP